MRRNKLLTVPASLALAGAAVAQDEAAEALGAGVGLVIGLVLAILIGALVGWLAGLIVRGGGAGFWTNLLVGIGGSLIASFLLPVLGLPIGNILGTLFAAVVGAVMLLLILRLLRRGAT